jgi:predicted site-specific integrase-resolvase
MLTKKFVEILGQKITEQNDKIVMLENRVRELEKIANDKDWLCSQVAYALQDVLKKYTALKIVTELNGQEITTKIIRDKQKELNEKREKLEWALKATNEALEELGEEQA